MALAPDGRLFVACSGDNTVHVIDTKIVEKSHPRGHARNAACPGSRPRDHLHLALPGVARGQHAGRRGRLARRQDAVRRQRG